MALKEQLQRLGKEKNSPCVTISLNTHRTHPDNEQDGIVLKKLLKEAEERVLKGFNKREVAQLLQNIERVGTEIDINYNLNSLHIFLSNDTKEIIKSSWATNNQGVHISDSFAIRPLIKSYNRSENYLVMLLSQSGVQLYEAVNDAIIQEIRNDNFPFSENKHYNTNSERSSDSKHLDDLVREFLNTVDKAVVKVNQETDLKCVVIATEDNYSRLQKVADNPSIYLGHDHIDYNNVSTHQIVQQSWKIIKEKQKHSRTEAIGEMKEAVSQGKVLTDLQEIYQAAIDGNGAMLMVHQDFSQPVLMKDERTFSLIDDVTIDHAIDDITSNIAWEVLAKKGTVYFTSQEELEGLGNIVLKTRY